VSETLGRYTLQRKLASGGMAEIWLASLQGPEGFRSQVVVKTILPHLASRPEFVKMFLHEARLAAKLRHPNITQIFELGEHRGTYFLAMEYVPGVDLRRLLREAATQRRPLPLPLAIRILIEVAQALAYAHAARDERGEPMHIVHRDVSPENILVTYEGGVKLVDFGIARAENDGGLTRTGVLKGKYPYLSPERVDGQPFDGRADLFALGVIAFELLTGQRLFRRETDVATLRAVTECAVPVPTSVVPQLPRELDAIVLRALARNPDERYPDGAAFAQAFEQFLLDSHTAATAPQLAAYLRQLFPNPEPPSLVDSADTDSHSGEHLAASPPQPTRSTRPPQSDPDPEQRTGQLAPRGPVRDPAVVRRETATLAIQQPKVQPRRPSEVLPIPTEPEASPDSEGTAPQLGRTTTQPDPPARLRRWAQRAFRLALLCGLVALGVAALPSLRRALRDLPGELTSEDPWTRGPRGRLSLDSTPVATVFLGTRRIGRTPLKDAELPVGPQQLHLVNDHVALDETIDVVVQPDQPLQLHPHFAEGTAELPIHNDHHYRVLYRDTLLGNIPGPAIELCVGEHDLALVDEQTGQRETRHVTVSAKGVHN
jgi:serine/threonine protein kinase